MTKKKSASTKAIKQGPATKAARARAGAAANPVNPQDVSQPPKAPKAASASAPPVQVRPPFQRPLNFAGVGRNDICPCGSGKRFKNCHGH